MHLDSCLSKVLLRLPCPLTYDVLRHFIRSTLERAAPQTANPPAFTAWYGDRRTARSVVHRPHLRAHADTIPAAFADAYRLLVGERTKPLQES